MEEVSWDSGGKRQRVLVQVQDAAFEADLRRCLQDLGYEVLPAAESGSGVHRCGLDPCPDVVLTDSGRERSEDACAVPVVWVDASAGEDEGARRSQELNAAIVDAVTLHGRAQLLFSEHAWLGHMLRCVSDGVIATDAEGRVRYMNPVAQRLTGWTLGEASGRPVGSVFLLAGLDGVPVESCPASDALGAPAAAGRERFLLRHRDGATTAIEDCASAIVESGQVTGAVSVFRDITERLRREREVADELGHTRAELRSLSEHLINAQEQERRRIALELHDDLGQITAVLGMEAARALAAVRSEDSELADLLRSMQLRLAEVDEGLRVVSRRLHPSTLEDLGLVPALQSLIEDFRRNGGQASIQAPEEKIRLPLHAATALYRIAQEALRNAMRHAGGAPIRVTVEVEPDGLVMAVEDAGPGFDLQAARVSGGLGLLSMQERARMVGGSLRVETQPGDGTSVVVRVPR